MTGPPAFISPNSHDPLSKYLLPSLLKNFLRVLMLHIELETWGECGTQRYFIQQFSRRLVLSKATRRQVLDLTWCLTSFKCVLCNAHHFLYESVALWIVRTGCDMWESILLSQDAEFFTALAWSIVWVQFIRYSMLRKYLFQIIVALVSMDSFRMIGNLQ